MALTDLRKVKMPPTTASQIWASSSSRINLLSTTEWVLHGVRRNLKLSSGCWANLHHSIQTLPCLSKKELFQMWWPASRTHCGVGLPNIPPNTPHGVRRLTAPPCAAAPVVAVKRGSCGRSAAPTSRRLVLRNASDLRSSSLVLLPHVACWAPLQKASRLFPWLSTGSRSAQRTEHASNLFASGHLVQAPVVPPPDYRTRR